MEDGFHFIVCDQGVYDALMTLPGAKRKIVLLSYFGEMNDREIGDALGTGRANVQYHRLTCARNDAKDARQESEEYCEQAKKQTCSIRNHRPCNAGRPQALEQVIRHYRPYILSLCRREYIAENGNVSIVCDNELKLRLEAKLMAKILLFDIRERGHIKRNT